MLRGRRYRAARFGGLAAALTLMAASAALAAPGVANKRADSGGDGTGQQLDSQADTALLSLYSLDSRLEGWRARLASLEHEATAVRQQRRSLRAELGADRASLKTGQRSLALDLRALYERGDVNAVAVVLGANSLTKGLKQLDDLSRVADESRQIVEATRTARHRLAALAAPSGGRAAQARPRAGRSTRRRRAARRDHRLEARLHLLPASTGDAGRAGPERRSRRAERRAEVTTAPAHDARLPSPASDSSS